MDFSTFKIRYQNEELLVGVDPPSARKLFVDMSRKKVEKEIEEYLFAQFFIVKTLYWLHWIILLTGMVFLGIALHWWSFLVIPIVFFLYLMIASKASIGNQTPWGSIIFLAICITVSWLWLNGFYLQLFISTFPIATLMLKVMYVAAITFMRELIVTNEKMYENLRENDNLILRNTVTGQIYDSNVLRQ